MAFVKSDIEVFFILFPKRHILVNGSSHVYLIIFLIGKTLLIHLLTVIADHRDHLGVARVLLNNKTAQLNYGLLPPNMFPHKKRFTGNVIFIFYLLTSTVIS